MAEFTAAQARAIRTLGVNVAVSAGAGAGKTRVLVERYLYILERREAMCGEILAITFTNKAAKEMKERIRAKANALERAAADEGERGFWREVKAGLEYAPIGTFHSFCARVLRDNPVEAGIDPAFAVLDEIEGELLREKALGEVLEAALADSAPWLERLLDSYDRGLLLALAPGLYDAMAGLGQLAENMAGWLAAPYQASAAGAAAAADELRSLCRELVAYKDNLNPKGAQYARVARLERDWDAVDAAIGAAAADAASGEVLAGYLDCLDRRSKDKAIVGEIKERLKALRLARADRAALALVPCWCELLLALDRALERLKQERRVLTFSDLEVRAARLLRENKAVLDRYRGRIRQIMVDEFQDTNELQRQIVYLLAGGDADVLQDGRLFVVGDAKQSIYRFRGADVAVFEQVKRDIAGAGEVIELDVNFRSLDSLLEVYNESFAGVMGTAEDVIAFRPLASHRRSADAGAVQAELLVVPRAGVAEAGGAREAEAAAVAARIRAMVGGEEELVGRDAAARAVCWGDIAILFRTAGNIECYAAALQAADIPFTVVGGRGFYRCQEITDMLNVLRVADNRFRDAALAGVLRSPLFMLADGTLACLKKDKGSLWEGLAEYGAASLDESQRLAAQRAWRILSRLRALGGLTGAAEVLEAALAETGYAEFVLTQFMGRQKYANLLKLVAAARDFGGGGLFTTADFLRYVDKLIAGEVKEGEAQLESEDGDAVRLMTIHKSKGLEFPVVFLPDLQRKFRDETAPALFSAAGGLGLKVPGPDGGLEPTSPYERLAAEERRLSLLELKRVLYVAFTRAEDYLVLSGVADKLGGDKELAEINNWLGWLGRVYGLNGLDDAPERLTVGGARLAVRCGAPEGAASCRPAAEKADGCAGKADLALIARNIAPLAAAGRLTPLSASNILRFRQCRRAFYYQFVAGLPEPEPEWEERDGENHAPPGRLTGNALHKCLELLRPGEAWEECLARAVREETPPEWRAAVLTDAAPLIAKYAAGSLLREISGLTARREWGFTFYIPPEGTARPGVLNGRVDCLVEYRDGSLGIIDYKTDRVDAASVGEKARHYGLQLVLYALAAEAATGRRVKDARLYFLRTDSAVTVPLDAAAREAALAGLRQVWLFAAEHRSEAEYACNPEQCRYCGFSVLCPGR